MFKVERREPQGFYYIHSEEGDFPNDHRLFLEWDNVDTANIAVQVLESLGVCGILIHTTKGYHFISRSLQMSLDRLLRVQTMFKACSHWIGCTKEEKKAILRVSHKVEGEKPLKVISYRHTDREMKAWYTKTIEEYFMKGTPYTNDSDRR